MAKAMISAMPKLNKFDFGSSHLTLAKQLSECVAD
jgi:hypothetical protein